MRILLHSYMTSGFIKWALLYLRTLKKYNGEHHTVFLDCRDITKKDISRIRKVYSNIIIRNLSIDYEKLASKTGFSVNKLKKLKVDVETKRKNINTLDKIMWKQFISVEERYRKSIPYAFNTYRNKFDYMLHLDIDTCFASSINPLLDIMQDKDVVFRFQNRFPPKRRHKKNKNRVIWGHTLGIQFNNKARDFITTWGEIIDSKTLKNKPKGFGQISLYEAFELHKDLLNWGYFPYSSTATDNVHKNNPAMRKKVILLTGNKGKKSKVYNYFTKVIK